MEDRKKRCLPPGFQFDPTDEELISYFLYYKANISCLPYNTYLDIIPELDFYHADPRYHLNGNAFLGERDHWYFFSKSTPNRCMKNGMWKELGFSEPIFTSDGSDIEIGTKKLLGFYADGIQSNWIMEGYHLVHDSNGLSKKQVQDCSEWVLCRVHEANSFNSGNYYQPNINDTELSYLDEIFLSVDDDDESEISYSLHG